MNTSRLHAGHLGLYVENSIETFHGKLPSGNGSPMAIAPTLVSPVSARGPLVLT